MKSSVAKLPDTNVIIHYLLKDDEKLHAIAHNFFKNVREGDEKAIILECVVTGCVYVLTKFYKVPKNEAVEKLKGLLNYKGVINKDKQELILALDMFSEKNIDIVDCIFCQKSQSLKMPLLSFDKALAKYCK